MSQCPVTDCKHHIKFMGLVPIQKMVEIFFKYCCHCKHFYRDLDNYEAREEEGDVNVGKE